MEENKDLYELLAKQAEMIAELKRQVENIKPITENVNVKELANYYQNQYLLLFDEITTPRWEKLKTQIAQLKQELKLVCDEKDQREKLLQTNRQILDQIKAWEDKIQNEYVDLEKIRFDTENQILELKDKRNALIEKDEGKWRRLISVVEGCKKGIIAFSEVAQEIEEMRNHAISTATVSTEELKKIDETVFALTQELNEANAKCQTEVQEINQRIAELKLGLQELTPSTIEDKRNELERQLNELENYFSALFESYEMLKKEHLDYIRNLLTRAEVIGETNKEIAQNMERFFGEARVALSEHDTSENKEKRERECLEKQKEKENLLEAQKIDLERTENDYIHLCNLYTTVKQNIKKVEDYVAKTTETINGSAAFQAFYNNWKNLQVKKGELQTKLSDKLKKLETDLSERKKLVYDPFAKDKLVALDQEIKSLKEECENHAQEIAEMEEAINNLSSQNKRISSVLSDVEKYEKTLPSLYQQLQAFKQLIDDKYQILLDKKNDFEMLGKGDSEYENNLERRD